MHYALMTEIWSTFNFYNRFVIVNFFANLFRYSVLCTHIYIQQSAGKCVIVIIRKYFYCSETVYNEI